MIKLGRNVIVREGILVHIKKHNLEMSADEIARLADRVTQGKEGLHVLHEPAGTKTIVIRGFEEIEGKKYGIVRTIWDDSAGDEKERTGLHVINHYQDLCRHTLRSYFSFPCTICNKSK